MNVWRTAKGADTRWDGTPSVVTIGNFDGVHLGHQHVLQRARDLAVRLADAAPLPVVAVTFDPHPMRVFAPDRAPLELTPVESRIALLRRAGADAVFVLAFDRDMAAWTPGEFVKTVVVDQLHAAGVVIGENFRFGHRAAGDIAFLRRIGPELGFEVDGVDLDGDRLPWSSTRVRALIADGDVVAAAALLGRLHTVSGAVVEGDKRGRKLGFPTANVPADPAVAVPADGVYAGWLRRLDRDGPALPAAISVGTNPTFDGVERRVESYVLDRTDLELYGVPVEVCFVERIRGQVTYTGVDDLVVQMHDDVQRTKEILGST